MNLTVCIYCFAVIFNVLFALKTVDDLKELKKIFRTNKNVLVAFYDKDDRYSDWVSVLDRASSEIVGRGSIIKVVCSESKKLCKKMKMSPSPLSLAHYKDGRFNRLFDRLKTVKSVLRFMEDPTGEAPWEEDSTAVDVVHLNSVTEFRQVATKANRPILVMFYAPWCNYCKRLKPEFAAAATEVKDSVILAGIDAERPDVGEIVRAFNISGYPTLYYAADKKRWMKYGGENTKEAIVKWLENPTPPSTDSADKEKAATGENEPQWSDEATDVVFLNETVFPSFMKEHASVLIMFYAPWCGHCKMMKPAYNEAAKVLVTRQIPGVLAAVDSTQEKALSEQFGVKGFPTLKYFENGQFKFDIHERETDKIVDFMKDPKEPPAPPPADQPWSETPSAVHHLVEEDFKTFLKKKKHVLVMFYAPWCGHCKKAKPEFMEAAEIMKENTKVALAAVDCTTSNQLCTGQGVEGFPTFKYFNYGKPTVEYKLGREADDFVAFLTDPENPPKPNQKRHWKSIEGYESVLLLDKGNFAEGIGTREGVLVMFYAPWCGHCKAMKPAFVEAATQIKSEQPGYALAAVDASDDELWREQYAVRSYPTLLYFNSDGTYEKYNEGRTLNDFVAFIQRKTAEKIAAKQREEDERVRKNLESEKLRQEAEEAKKKEQERVRQEKAEAERLALEKKRMEEEKLKREAEEAKKKEQERVRQEKAETERLALEKKRMEEEKLKREAERLESEKKRLEEEKRKEDQKQTEQNEVVTTHEEFASRTANGHLLVLFYRTSGGSGYKTTLSKITETLAAVRARGVKIGFLPVDCTAGVALCDKEGVETAQLLRFYSSGKVADHFSGAFNVNSMENFVQKQFKDEL